MKIFNKNKNKNNKKYIANYNNLNHLHNNAYMHEGVICCENALISIDYVLSVTTIDDDDIVIKIVK